MTTTVKFGVAGACRLSLGEHTLLAPDAERHPMLDDPAAAVRAALGQPLGYPPLAAATVPGDRVTVAVDADLPRVSEVVRGALGGLKDAGVDPALTTVVTALSAAAHGRLADASSMQGAAASFQRHDPDDEQALAIIGRTASGRKLRLNRALVEADFVLLVTTVQRAADRVGGPVKFHGLLPQFSNRETINRFAARRRPGTPRGRADERGEIDEAGWLLGVGMCVRVVVGPGGGVSGVFAGDPEAVARKAARRFRDIWHRSAAQKGDLVIAALAGDEDEQTWENLARALSASERVRGPNGAIAVCTNLAEPPGDPFNRLAEADDPATARRELRRDPGAEARAARVLARALERGPVYLKSRLPVDVVESLGMTAFDSDAELSRLASTRGHCVVIEEAQRVRPQLVGAPRH